MPSPNDARTGDEGILILATQSDADTPPAAWTRVHVAGPTKLACGHFHYLAIGRAGLYSWGRGPLGVLGHGGEDDELRPRVIEALAGEPIDAVAAGPYHSAAVTADGRLYLWGWLPFAPTPDGGMEETFSRVPRAVSLDAVRVAGVACGCFAPAAWDARGQLYTWGRNTSGHLGHGSELSAASPRPVEALTGVRIAQVAFGGVQAAEENTGFMIVRSEAGVLFSCGCPKRGRLGRPYSTDALSLSEEGQDEQVHYGVPGEVTLGYGSALASTIAAGDNHAAAITVEGGLYVWGANEAGLLGIGAGASDAEAPLEITELPPLANVVCTAYSTAFTARSGELLLLGGDPAVTRPRLAGLPGRIAKMFGGGHHLGVVLMGLKPGASSSALAAHVHAEEKEEAREAEALLPKPAMLAADLNLDEAVAPEIAELLLGDPAGSTPLQLRHELRLLRDLISAERHKLHMIQHGKPEVSDLDRQAVEASPSGDTWTGQNASRAPVRKESTYAVTMNMETHTGGMMYVAKESVLYTQKESLAERQASRRKRQSAK